MKQSENNVPWSEGSIRFFIVCTVSFIFCMRNAIVSCRKENMYTERERETEQNTGAPQEDRKFLMLFDYNTHT